MKQHSFTALYQEQQLFFQVIMLQRQIFAWIGIAPPRLSTLCLATPTPLVRHRRTVVAVSPSTCILTLFRRMH